MYSWLINHKVLGLYIKSYIEYKAITKTAKIVSVFTLWLFISISIIFFLDNFYLRLLLLFIAIGVSIHLLSMKTLTEDMLQVD